MNPIFVLSVLDSESYTLQFWYTFLHSVEPDISHEVISLPILLNLKFNQHSTGQKPCGSTMIPWTDFDYFWYDISHNHLKTTAKI